MLERLVIQGKGSHRDTTALAPLSLTSQPAQLGPESCPCCLWKPDEAVPAASAATSPSHTRQDSGMLGGP